MRIQKKNQLTLLTPCELWTFELHSQDLLAGSMPFWVQVVLMANGIKPAGLPSLTLLPCHSIRREWTQVVVVKELTNDIESQVLPTLHHSKCDFWASRSGSNPDS